MVSIERGSLTWEKTIASMATVDDSCFFDHVDNLSMNSETKKTTEGDKISQNNILEYLGVNR